MQRGLQSERTQICASVKVQGPLQPHRVLFLLAGQPEPSCKCFKSFKGASCEQLVNWCFNNCNGRGTCRHQFCHCKPPYFSMDCSRSKVYPIDHSMPNPADFRIFM
ncbi:hypothetical protein ABPG77_002465 [Micractinium sp. CCAP 211/92]